MNRGHALAGVWPAAQARVRYRGEVRRPRIHPVGQRPVAAAMVAVTRGALGGVQHGTPARIAAGRLHADVPPGAVDRIAPALAVDVAERQSVIDHHRRFAATWWRIVKVRATFYPAGPGIVLLLQAGVLLMLSAAMHIEHSNRRDRTTTAACSCRSGAPR